MAEEFLVATDLHKSFHDFKAVDGVSFTIEKGEIFGLLGPNGAGKTTTIRMLSTVLPSDSGDVVVGGHSLRKDAAAVRALIGVCPQDLALYEDLPQSYREQSVRLTSNQTGRPTERPLREVLQERYAEITAMDRAIGKLRDYLKREGLRDNTLVWYCGDNGTPPSGVLASPLRGRKGQVYEGGTRVPGVIEWPARITAPRVSEANAVTSDMLPTLCALAGVPAPGDRPLDGVNLVPLFDGSLRERTAPIFFWCYGNWQRLKDDPKPWIDLELQKGTTPLVKLMGGIPTRNFRNYHHPDIRPADYDGPRVMLGNRHKLVIHDAKGDGDASVELFDLHADPAEERNLAESEPAIVGAMQTELRSWQQSVLESLTGADYAK